MKRQEETLQKMVVTYLQLQYPQVLFKCDPYSGLTKLPPYLAKKAKELGNTKGWPDVSIAAVRQGYCGLYLELKKEGEGVFLKNGQLSQRQHIQKQNAILTQLRNEGYYAEFAEGFAQAKKIIDWYLS